MPRGRRPAQQSQDVGDYRHKGAKRKNNPPAGIAPTYEAREREKTTYSYDPHLDPQLVWAGKAEHTSFAVDVVPLHIHERISTRAILEAVRKPEPQLALFGNNELPMDKQIEFYRHDVGWANRLILGDSLLVMNSMLVKEGMAGKVQCIYIDPPYGIKYASNMQARVDRRDVKDADDDLTREPEQIKAYRDTWKLGIHSYLTYLRDRLLLARDLLTESGSVFVQINDENLHLVRALMDEVMGRENVVSVVAFKKTSGFSSEMLANVTDYLIWYARDKSVAKFRAVLEEKLPGEQVGAFYDHVELPDGSRQRLRGDLLEYAREGSTDRVFQGSVLYSDGATASGGYEFSLEGVRYSSPAGTHWKTGQDGMRRLLAADRVFLKGNTPRYVRFFNDYPFFPLANTWMDTGFGGFVGDQARLYAVQTYSRVIERCILMTTDPGDLVFDPTCGSGTTALCAETWGRRWVTCDTSRVALQIARQRLLTSKYDYFELQDAERGPSAGFKYETVPHITLESIAKNPEIDAIAAKHQPSVDSALKALNKALHKKWQEWEVPRELDRAWNKDAREAHREFWAAKRKKRQEIDASIQRNAPQETLYDKPLKKSGVVRVSGPFTVEGIPAPAVEAPDKATPIPQFETSEAEGRVADPAGDYLTMMIGLLNQQGGVIFPKGKKLELVNLRPLSLGLLHAEAESGTNGSAKRVAVSFGPQYGPVIAYQVSEAIQSAKMNGYDILVLAGFSFEAEAHSFLQKARESVKGLQIHFANVAPDVLVGDLLKTSRTSQIFTVYGEPDISPPQKQKDGTYVVELRGVDVYDPLTGEVNSTKGGDVAAWFLDTDYDGMTFHICQAFFPGDKDAWEKLQRALKAQIEPETFELMRGTKAFSFKPGKHNRIAVKVIDFRGNEVMRTVGLEAGTGKAR